MESRKQPEVRFSKFKENWEEHKFEELLDSKDGVRRGPFGSALKKEIFVSESDYVVYEQQNAIYDNYKTRYNIPESKFKELSKFSLSEGDFIMSGAGTIGRISRVPKGIKKGVFNQALIRFRINEKLTDSEYFIQFIRADNMQRKLTGANPGSAITNLVPMTEVKKWEILVPNKDEQKELGNFLKNIDEVISLHQQELTTLKQTKQGFLQKKFPKEGEKVPEVRFPGFIDDWEQRKLGESVNFLNGRAYKQQELLDEGKYRVLRVGNFNTNDRWYYSDLELEENKYADKGDLLYLWATNFGPEIWNEERVIYHYHIWKLALQDENLDKQYLYTWLETDKERIKQTTNGTTMVHVTKGNMEGREFQFPHDITEQKKIGEFFKQLDNLITLQQRELELLQLTKKAFLQKLFV